MIDWADLLGVWVPTWLSSIGTIGAFATGGALLVRELQRDRQRAQSELREHAGLFGAWPEWSHSQKAQLDVIEAKLHVSNLANEPFYDVVVEYHDGPSATPIRESIGLVTPGTTSKDAPGQFSVVWVRADDGWHKRGDSSAGPTSDPTHTPPFAVAAEFTDSAGRRWRREPTGSLSEVTP